MLDLIVHDDAPPAASSPATSSRATSAATPPTRWCWPRVATATSTTCPRTRWRATSPPGGGPIGAGRCSRTRATPRSTPPASRRVTSSRAKLTLMSRVAAQRRPHLGAARRTTRPERLAKDIPDAERYYYLEEKYPAFGNLVPRDVASRNAKTVVDQGLGVGPLKNGVFLDFADAISRDGEDTIRAKYGNLFDMYERITGENPYERPMRIYPATHYTMGGLWVDYELQSNVPGLFVDRRGQLLRSRRQPPRRVGAHAGPGRRLLRAALHHRQLPGPAAGAGQAAARTTPPPRADAVQRGRRSDPEAGCRSTAPGPSIGSHRELGKLVWGLHRHGARQERPREGASTEIPALREEFEKDVRVLGSADSLNSSLEKVQSGRRLLRAGRAEGSRRARARGVVWWPLPHREPDRGGARPLRDDENFAHVAAWEWGGDPGSAIKHKEELTFENVALTQRSVQVEADDERHRDHLNLTLKVWRQAGPNGRPAASRPTRSSEHQRGHVVPRDVRCPERAAHQRRARSRSRSPPTAARASAARAAA